MEEENERVSKKEINRSVNDTTYKHEVNIRDPKQKPYKRTKNVNYYDQIDEEDAEEKWADEVEYLDEFTTTDDYVKIVRKNEEID